MAAINKTASDQLERIKKNVQTAHLYFQGNAKRYREFKKYVFKESINQQQRSVLQELNRPQVEFNILEAYISRLLGEFAQQEPSIEITPSEGVPIPQEVLDIVEGHVRHAIYTANKDGFSYQIYKDLLAGGYSVGKVWTDYSSPMSFNQEIFWDRAFDPTLVGFDPMARAPHKGDGQFSFEIYPMLEEDLKREYPDIQIGSLGMYGDIEGFSWSYKNAQNQKIILCADYYEKKKRKVKIVKLANGRCMRIKDYEKLLAYWEENQFFEQPPVVVGKPRMTILETICRYRFIANQVLEYYETDYSYLPHVFFDGNSIDLVEGTDNTTYQMTRPYVYHAKGIQDLKNYAGIALANFLENMIQHKFIVKKEAIPQEMDYLEALNDIQRANTVVVNAYSENNPDKPIPEPIREIQNIPAPPEVMGAFQVTDPTTQTILGSFASNLGKNDNDLSGKAVIESSTVGNAAAMPYVVGYLAGLKQMATIHVDLMPKYIVGKRTIPITSLNGETNYRGVNGAGEPRLSYDEHAIKVNIEAGVNFQVQKNQAVQQVIALMNASPSLGEFFNDEDGGLPILAKNLTIYGADELPEAIQRWAQKKQQMQQQAMQAQQQAMMQNPAMIRAQVDAQKAQIQAQVDKEKLNLERVKLQSEQQQNDIDNQIAIAKLANEKILADSKVMEAEAKVSQAQIDSAVRLEESQTSLEVHSLEAASKLAEIQSRAHKDNLAARKLEHEINNVEGD
ncbi:MAG: portal protein [Candidatus Nitrosocosmicus sp.]